MSGKGSVLITRNMTLDKLLVYIENSLKGSNVHNEETTIKARVKLPDEDRIVELKIIGVSAAINQICGERRRKMAGMYPPTHEAIVYIDCETEKD